jgi:hypothetical protein
VSDLEDRLRVAVARQSATYRHAPDLPDRILDRVARRRRAHRRRVGTAVTALTAAAVVVVFLVRLPAQHEGSTWSTDESPSATEPGAGTGPPATPPGTASAGPAAAPSTTKDPGRAPDRGDADATAAPADPGTPAVDILTPLSRAGLGPIVAGMTVRAAQEAAGVALTLDGGATGTCAEALIEGVDGTVLLVEPRGPGSDPLDGTVRAVVGGVMTEEGFIVGSSRDELIATYGQPTRIESRAPPYTDGAELLFFEADGVAYGALVFDDLVTGMQSGDPAWVGYQEGCP